MLVHCKISSRFKKNILTNCLGYTCVFKMHTHESL